MSPAPLPPPVTSISGTVGESGWLRLLCNPAANTTSCHTRPYNALPSIIKKDTTIYYHTTRSLGALRAPNSSWRPFGSLDFVLRALRALRPGDPRNDVVIGREDHRNVKKIVKKSKNCVEKYIKPKNITDKSKKYHG